MGVTPKRVAFVCLILTVTLVSAQEFFVAYVEGRVEHRLDGRWVESGIGDTFPAGTEVRLEGDGFLEVVSGNRTIRYAQEGLYRLGDAEGPTASESTDLGGLIRGTVSRFTRTSASPSERAISAGVRASEAAQEPTIEWAGDETPEELIAEGIAALRDEKTEDASFLFEDAYVFADGPVRDRAGFYLVYTLYLLDEHDLALETLAELSPEPTEPYYPDFAMVAGEIYLTTGDPATAAEILQRAIDNHRTIETEDPLVAQGLYYLLGRAVESTDATEAAEFFRRAAKLAPPTAVGVEAASR